MEIRPVAVLQIAVATALSPILAVAQTPPDAGSLLQQIDRERALQLPRRIAPERPAEPTPMRPTPGAVVTVREFRFAGNTLLSTEQLLPAVAEYLDRPLDFTQLQAAAAAVAKVYREAGWIVRAYLPAQDIQDGIVTIQIVEAVFGKVLIEGQPARRVDSARVIAIFVARQKPGDRLNTAALDRALLLADDLPGVTIVGSLQPGTAPGETDLVVKLADEPLIIGEAGLDNTGSRSTGSERLSANINLISPLGLADTLAFSGIHTEGSDYGRLGASFPLGSDGWRVGANASYLAYQLVAPEFAALDARGSSSTRGLEASYPLVRSRLKNLFLAVNYDWKRFDNESSGTTTSRYELAAATVAINGNLFDNWGGGGASSASLAWAAGQLDLAGSPNQAADAATTRAAGHYTKFRFNLSRQQVLTDDLALFALYSGQLASKNLDSSEKFYLGGANGVRAYPANEGGGSEGEMLNLELRWRLPAGFTLTGFHDWGRVTVNRDNDFAGAPTLNRYHLKGHGLALAWQTPLGANLKAVWARREGDNPNPTTTGRDQDGSLDKDRFWLSASIPF